MEELQKISASEVSRHCTKQDCWLVINGKVYDVTKFLDDHPGGEDVLIHESGNGDATQAFEDVGHSSTARSMMTSFLIGVLGGEPKAGGGERHEPVKPKPAIKHTPQPSQFTVVDFILPLLILAVAVVSWYMLTHQSSD